MAQIRRWQDLKSHEFAKLDPETTVAVLPVGAIEQHGPHLPVSVDALIAEAVAERAFARLDDDIPALLLPTSKIGKSNEHIDFPGTLTLSAETLGKVWFEIGRSVARAGVRKIIFLNAHGGQPQVMEIVARELRVAENMMAVTTGWWHVGGEHPAVPEDERRHGIHAGMVETSMMLALAPELVDMERAENFHPVMAQIEGTHEKLRYLGGVGMGWQAQDIHPSGAAGNAAAATAGLGAEIIDAAVSGLAKLIAEVSRYPLSALKSR